MSGKYTAVWTVTKSGSNYIDGILSGYGWAGAVTYAFPTSKASYAYKGEKDDHFKAISAAQKNAALFAMETSFGNSANDGFSIEGFTKLGFTAGANAKATLRFAQSDDPATAHAYYPAKTDKGGDLWFGTAYAGTVLDLRKPVAGNYAWHVMLHELGHALGLKHGHERENGFPALPWSIDSIEYSIMTYRGYVGSKSYTYEYEQWGAPQTYMMLDIAALQRMYGADFTANAGNTVYQWRPNSGDTLVNGKVGIDAGANRIFATIWDGGGNDTYDLSLYKTNLTLNLKPGGYSAFSAVQLAYLGGGPNKGYAGGNIYNALLYQGRTASLIENAKGGSGNDVITGNQAKNKLYGNGGDDTLFGEEENDTLHGGGGSDWLYGDAGNDVLHGSDGNDRLYGDIGNDALYGGNGSDTIEGNAGDDLIDGGDGNDGISGHSGIDTIYGGGGYDTIDGGDGDDMLAGDAGNDTLDGGYGNDLLYGGAGADKLYGFHGNDTLLGNDGNDTLFGDARYATLTGGNDTLYGGAGNDRLSGQVGDDTIDGDDGEDTLNGGQGRDTLTGGEDADTFVFRKGFGQDTIADFRNGVDKILLYDYIEAHDSWEYDPYAGTILVKDSRVTQNGTDLHIKFSATDILVLKDFNRADLTYDDYV